MVIDVLAGSEEPITRPSFWHPFTYDHSFYIYEKEEPIINLYSIPLVL